MCVGVCVCAYYVYIQYWFGIITFLFNGLLFSPMIKRMVKIILIW